MNILIKSIAFKFCVSKRFKKEKDINASKNKIDRELIVFKDLSKFITFGKLIFKENG